MLNFIIAEILNYMKKHLLILISLLFTGMATAFAQNDKGSYYIGGSFNYNYTGLSTTQTYNFTEGYTNYSIKDVKSITLQPDFGFFLSKKWSVGIQPVYQRQSGTEESDYYSYTSAADNYVSTSKYHNDQLGINLYLRYYCMITDKFGFFPQFGVGTLNNLRYPDFGTLTFGGSPYFVFFPTPKLGVNLGFGSIGYNIDYKTGIHNFNLGVNNNITFGLNYYWAKK